MHEAPLKFCSAGEELAWQSLIPGGEQGGCSQHNPSPSLPSLQGGHGLGMEAVPTRAQPTAVPTSKVIWGQGCTPALPEGLFPVISPLQVFCSHLFHRALVMESSQLFPMPPPSHPSSNSPGLNPGLPILLQPQLENKAQKIPVDPQAMD